MKPTTVPVERFERGAIMAAMVLNSARATEMSVYVVRAFVRLREVLAAHKDFASKLDALEKRTAVIAFRHDALAANTRAQFKAVFDALRDLMAPPEPKKKRPIGFVHPKD